MVDRRNPKFVMTIDGPGGSGKDTLAENFVKSAIFEPYKVKIFNTGNFSRSIAYATLCAQVDPEDPAFKSIVIDAMNTIDFVNVDPIPLFSSAVEKRISDLSKMPEIRTGFAEKLPGIIAGVDSDVVIALGRITGPLYPQATIKLFLETSPEVCADRRALARSLKGENYEAVKQDLLERNKNDVANWSSHYPAPHDTIYVNTDNKLQIEVFQEAVHLASGQINSLFL